jgi:sphingolipid 8-(E)-desaturase
MPKLSVNLQKSIKKDDIEKRILQGETIVIVQDKAYNLTKWLKYHPGGHLAIKHMNGKSWFT